MAAGDEGNRRARSRREARGGNTVYKGSNSMMAGRTITSEKVIFIMYETTANYVAHDSGDGNKNTSEPTVNHELG